MKKVPFESIPKQDQQQHIVLDDDYVDTLNVDNYIIGSILSRNDTTKTRKELI